MRGLWYLFTVIATLVGATIAFGQTTGKVFKSFTAGNAKIVVETFERPDAQNNSSETYFSVKIFEGNSVIEKQENITQDQVSGVWLSDLDHDGRYEISLAITSAGSGAYGNLFFYEYDKGIMIRRNLPELNNTLKNLYRGHDTIRTSENTVAIEFPAYNTSDPNSNPTGGSVTVEYEFAGDQFIEGSFSRKKPDINEQRRNRAFVLTVKSVSGLPNMDGLSPSDCWLKVFIGDRLIGVTERVPDNNNPIFDKVFDIVSYSDELIRIEAYDRDMTKDEPIGVANIVKPISGPYPISFEDRDGSIVVRGSVEIVVEKR